MQEASWSGPLDVQLPPRPAARLVPGEGAAPRFQPKRAEAFLPWSLPGARCARSHFATRVTAPHCLRTWGGAAQRFQPKRAEAFLPWSLPGARCVQGQGCRICVSS